MSRPSSSLRLRLLLSHLAVVAVGVAVVLIAGRQLGSLFVDDHLRSMGSMMGGTSANEMMDLEAGIDAAFNRALLVATAISVLAALSAASFAATRVLRPLGEVQRVARRLASGSYRERVPVPSESELAALANDVNSLADQLEQTEQRRIRLISDVAHELRTPVATLKGYMEGLLDGVFEPDAETLSSAVREAERMERLAADLSSLSRSEEGRIDLSVAKTDVTGLVNSVAERLRPQFVDKGVSLRVESGTPIAVQADPDRLTQVLTNVVGNALTYTAAGGRVSIATRLRGGGVEVEIADTGLGLNPEQLESIFERFYRVDRALPGGTGIGLTIARNFARLHGGDLVASSDGIGCGSSFVLTLPNTIA